MEDLNEVNPKNNLVEKEPCNCGYMKCLSKAENPIATLEQEIRCLFGDILTIQRSVKRQIDSIKKVMKRVTDDEFKKVQKNWAYAKYGSGSASRHLYLDLKRIENCNKAQTFLKNNQENEIFQKYLLWKQKYAKVIQKFLSLDEKTFYSYRCQVLHS
ncbi:GSCOCG00009040001-RA-CDS [Cotesia congregata]|uniref:Uncharacterized protein n=1 Tax=Cotesia congregata TaxID=51543 RepID=A0A8J2H8B5_COTCN|nr:GSCOCG00009040001-RA-CDS [Cotesia congregata]CAG5083268.1 Protein of unknown function [Cotesia congregata]